MSLLSATKVTVYDTKVVFVMMQSHHDSTFGTVNTEVHMARANNASEWRNARQLRWRYDALVSARRGCTECASRGDGETGAGARRAPPLFPSPRQLCAALCVGLIDRARPHRGTVLLPCHSHCTATQHGCGVLPSPPACTYAPAITYLKTITLFK